MPCAPPDPLASTLLVMAAALVVHVGQAIVIAVVPVEVMGELPATVATAVPEPPIGGLLYAPLGD